MRKKVDEMIANIESVIATGDVAYEYEDFIGGKVHPPHHELVSSSVLMMSVLDTRYTLYRIIQFINLSQVGMLINVDNNLTRHMNYIQSVYLQMKGREAEITTALEDIVKNRVLISDGKPLTQENAESVAPILNEQLEDLAKHSRIATFNAQRIREGRKYA